LTTRFFIISFFSEVVAGTVMREEHLRTNFEKQVHLHLRYFSPRPKALSESSVCEKKSVLHKNN